MFMLSYVWDFFNPMKKTIYVYIKTVYSDPDLFHGKRNSPYKVFKMLRNKLHFIVLIIWHLSYGIYHGVFAYFSMFKFVFFSLDYQEVILVTVLIITDTLYTSLFD